MRASVGTALVKYGPLVAVWLVAVAAVVVASQSRAQQATAMDLSGKTWRLAWVAGSDVAGDVTAELTFTDDGKFSGSGGCNLIFGGYTLEAGAFDIKGVARSRKLCPPPVMAVEDPFVAALDAATGVEVTPSGEFVLSDASGRLAVLK